MAEGPGPYTTLGYASFGDATLKPWTFERRALRDEDVLIDILYSGVCHSDYHTISNEWGEGPRPLVVGHEIVGKVGAVGIGVTKFKVGDVVGVGCYVDACRLCEACKNKEGNYCKEGTTFTYGSNDRVSGELTHGGYSQIIVVAEPYINSIPAGLFDKLPAVAPLLCAGITTWSPLKKYGAGPGKKVAILGLGGLGHMAVKWSKALGADVTVISTSPSKKEEALTRLGADHFLVSTNPDEFTSHKDTFDIVIDTVSAPHKLDDYFLLLKKQGTLVMLGLPPGITPIPSTIIARGIQLAGSLIGSVEDAQDMLEFAAEKGIVCDIEEIDASYINEAMGRMLKNDVRYRFVIKTKETMK